MGSSSSSERSWSHAFLDGVIEGLQPRGALGARRAVAAGVVIGLEPIGARLDFLDDMLD
jgi:hypothetical protein